MRNLSNPNRRVFRKQKKTAVRLNMPGKKSGIEQSRAYIPFRKETETIGLKMSRRGVLIRTARWQGAPRPEPLVSVATDGEVVGAHTTFDHVSPKLMALW